MRFSDARKVSSSHFLLTQSTPAEQRLGFVRQSIQRVAPAFEQPVGFLIRVAEILRGQRVQTPLHIEGADRPAVFQFHDPALGRIARDFPGRLDRIEQCQIVRQKPGFEEGENAGGGPYLQRIGERAHVRVADEQMQPAIFPIIGQRLVARVDDRAVELHPLVNVIHDMVGPLAELKIDRLFRRRHFEIEGEGIGLARPGPPR